MTPFKPVSVIFKFEFKFAAASDAGEGGGKSFPFLASSLLLRMLPAFSPNYAEQVFDGEQVEIITPATVHDKHYCLSCTGISPLARSIWPILNLFQKEQTALGKTVFVCEKHCPIVMFQIERPSVFAIADCFTFDKANK